MFQRVITSRKKKKNKEHGSFPKLLLQNKRKGHYLSQASQLQVNRLLSAQKRRYSFGKVEMFFPFQMFYNLQKIMTKNLILIALFCLAIFQVHSQSSYEKDFREFQALYGKSYSEHETRYRMQVYLVNKNKIERHNAQAANTWEMGTTQFADLTQEEFVYTHLTLMTPNLKLQVQNQVQDLTVGTKSNLNVQQTPIVQAKATPVNWTAHGKMTHVKDQGNCGSCYAFAAVAAMESASLIQKKGKILLSEQQLVDCSGGQGNSGCAGGWPANAYTYIINNGITTEALYPYTGSAGQCNTTGGDYKISSFKSPYGCSNLIKEIAKRPMTVELDATNWYLYKKGVFNSCSSPAQINHAVTLAGVDAKANWWIKNSWGTYWGMRGYILLKAGNTCGICNYPGYAPYF